MSEKTTKLEPGMMLVYTSATYLSEDEKAKIYKDIEDEACRATCRVPRNLLVGILILQPSNKLEVLPKPEPIPAEVAEKFKGYCEGAKHIHEQWEREKKRVADWFASLGPADKITELTKKYAEKTAKAWYESALQDLPFSKLLNAHASMQEHVEKYHDGFAPCKTCGIKFQKRRMLHGLGIYVCRSCFLTGMEGKSDDSNPNT